MMPCIPVNTSEHPSSLSTNSLPARASLLGLPGELRRHILEYVFTDSVVTFEKSGVAAPVVNARLETSIIRSCATLHKEGQSLLASATKLFHHDCYSYFFWNSAIKKTYQAKIQYLSLSIDPHFASALDARALPSLKLLELYQDDEVTKVPRLRIDEITWRMLLKGDRDESSFIADWYKFAFEANRERVGYYREGPELFTEASWLFDLIDKKLSVPFKVVMQCRLQCSYIITDARRPDKEKRGLLVAINFDVETHEVVFRSVVEEDYLAHDGALVREFMERAMWMLGPQTTPQTQSLSTEASNASSRQSATSRGRRDNMGSGRRQVEKRAHHHGR